MAQIKVVALFKDGGDGGGSVRLYNSLDELRDNYFDDYDTVEERQAVLDEVLSGHDPYENGEINQNVTIEVETSPDGTLRLVGSVFLHFGQ